MSTSYARLESNTKSVTLNQGEPSFDETLVKNEKLLGLKTDISNLKTAISKPWETKLRSQKRVVRWLANVLGLGIPLLIAKIHDYAIRKLTPDIDDVLLNKDFYETIEEEKRNVTGSMAASWAAGYHLYFLEGSTEAAFNPILRRNKQVSICEGESFEFRRDVAQARKWTERSIKEGDVSQAKTIFLHDNKDTLHRASDEVQAVHAQMAGRLEYQLQREGTSVIYDKVKQACNDDDVKALEFLSLLTKDSINHHLEKTQEKWTSEYGEYKYALNDEAVRITINLDGQTPKATITAQVTLRDAHTNQQVGLMDYRSEITFRQSIKSSLRQIETTTDSKFGTIREASVEL